MTDITLIGAGIAGLVSWIFSANAKKNPVIWEKSGLNFTYMELGQFFGLAI
jgi:thioredoxin reductase